MIPQQTLEETLRFLRDNRRLIFVPVVICLGLGVLYALFSPRNYEAAQTMLLRDDLLGESFKPGRFQSEESLKSAQQTVLHIARKPMVVAAALQEAFPEIYTETPPETDDLESICDAISLSAPNGAEFGKTDVVVLSVKDRSPEKASRFSEALSRQVQENLRQVHYDLLTSMLDELKAQYAQTSETYEATAARLQAIEDEVGADLQTLRAMIEVNGGSSELQRGLEQIRQEKRSAQNELDLVTQQLEHLRQAQHQGERSLATNSELLQMQPVLARLFNGLVDAQLKLAADSGKYLPEHPVLENDRNAIRITRQQIQDEMGTIEQGLFVQRGIALQKLQRIENLEANYQQRSEIVNRNRVEYQTLSLALAKQGEAKSKLQSNLTELKSLTAPDQNVSLINCIGAPEVRKVRAMSRSLIVIITPFLGGLIGLGLALLIGNSFPSFLDPTGEGRNKNMAAKPASPSRHPESRTFGSGTSSTPRRRPFEIAQSAAEDDGTGQEFPTGDPSESGIPHREQPPAPMKNVNPGILVGNAAFAGLESHHAPASASSAAVDFDSLVCTDTRELLSGLQTEDDEPATEATAMPSPDSNTDASLELTDRAAFTPATPESVSEPRLDDGQMADAEPTSNADVSGSTEPASSSPFPDPSISPQATSTESTSTESTSAEPPSSPVATQNRESHDSAPTDAGDRLSDQPRTSSGDLTATLSIPMAWGSALPRLPTDEARQRPEAGPSPSPTATHPPEKTLVLPAAPAIDDDSEYSPLANQQRLKEQLARLSESINAYCDPIRKPDAGEEGSGGLQEP